MSPSTLTIGAIVVAAISEILPYTPIKANSVVQLAVQILQLVFRPGFKR
jgi:hypothetical protein